MLDLVASSLRMAYVRFDIGLGVSFFSLNRCVGGRMVIRVWILYIHCGLVSSRH